MAVKFPFVSAFLCEKILQEKDGINTAIRIVDIFNIAADAPPDAGVHFFGFIPKLPFASRSSAQSAHANICPMHPISLTAYRYSKATQPSRLD
jgi:hypothetical protein